MPPKNDPANQSQTPDLFSSVEARAMIEEFREAIRAGVIRVTPENEVLPVRQRRGEIEPRQPEPAASKDEESAHVFPKDGIDGKNRFDYFMPDFADAAATRLELEVNLRRALDRGEFSLHYQPQFDLQDGKLVGQEALLRWNHPKFGVIAPDRFIPIAEENGLIVPIGAWVLQEACVQTAAWRKAGHQLQGVSVNVSGVQFGRADFVDSIGDTLGRTGLDPKFLELELSEGLVIRDVRESANKMQKLRSLGVQISVDDFGAGYASIGYLQRLPIDVLKLDRSFVEESKMSSGDTSLVRKIVSFVHGLGIRVTAEGIETEEQLDLVHRSGCDKAQGFLLGRPSPAASALSSPNISPSRHDH